MKIITGENGESIDLTELEKTLRPPPYFVHVFQTWDRFVHHGKVASVAKTLNPIAANVYLSIMEKSLAHQIGIKSGIAISESMEEDELLKSIRTQQDKEEDEP